MVLEGSFAYGDAVDFAAVRNADSDLVSIGHGSLTRSLGPKVVYQLTAGV
jgi:hypothetical protein